MTGFLDSLAEIVRERVDRHRNWPFLNAAMAACALVATSNGEVSFCQRIRVDQILEKLDRLRGFDPHEGVDLFNEFVEEISRDPEAGHKKALHAVVAVGCDKPIGELLIRVCLAVSESEGKISARERKEIRCLCRALEIDPGCAGLAPDPMESPESE